jgi:repressor LexA
MADSIPTRLRELRTRAGLSMERLARAIGLAGASSYQRYEDPALFTKDHLPLPMVRKLLDVLPGKGSPPISKEEVAMLAGIEGLTVPQLEAIDDQSWIWCVGEVAAGVWRDSFEWDRDDWKPVVLSVRDDRYPRAKRTALLVRGDSMDQIYPEGTYIIYVRFEDIGSRPREGNKVIAVRRRPDLIEATAKILKKDGGGKTWLVPNSSNPKHTAIPLDGPDSEGIEVDIIGLIVGSHRLE